MSVAGISGIRAWCQAAVSGIADKTFGWLRITSQMGLHVNLRDNAGTELGTAGNPLVTSGGGGGGSVTQGTTPWVENVSQFGGSNVVTGTGAGGAGIPRVTVSSDSFPATQPVSGTVAVSNFPATQPVSGTVSANQAGTWTVQPGNTANTTAWKVDGSAVTQPVSGTVTATQATGTNLHVVVDTAPTTAVTNAGLTNLDVALSTRTKPTDQQHAIIDSGTTVVTQPTGTNLHAVLDATSTTTVTQATGTNLHVVVDSAPSTAVAGTVTANQGTASATAVWPHLITTAAELAVNQYATIFPAGYLKTVSLSSQLFSDAFDTVLDIANRWQTPVIAGGDSVTTTSGSLTLGTGTTAGGYSFLNSQPTFLYPSPGWLELTFIIKLESPVTANAYRYWGTGLTPGSPSATTPVADGIGFELGIDGKLYAVVYANSVRTQIQDFSAATGNSKQPTDANFHRYGIYVKSSTSYWFIDKQDAPPATSSYNVPLVQTLPILLLGIAGTTPPSTSGVLNVLFCSVSDQSHTNQTISDGTYKWRQATIKPASAPATVNDSALVTCDSPNSVLSQNILTVVNLLSNLVDISTACLREQRIMNFYLQSGLNVLSDPDDLRTDPYYSSLN